MKVSENGLCKVSEQYFVDFASPRHMFNKQENRPYFLAIRGENNIIWLVPLSSKTAKYRAKIEADEVKHGTCIFYFIARVKGEERAFLIGNTIPVTDDYILGPWMMGEVPFIIEDQADIKAIRSKLRRYLALVRRGKLRPAVDILSIERVLLNRQQNQSFIV